MITISMTQRRMTFVCVTDNLSLSLIVNEIEKGLEDIG
jgi:hypothetical protein